VKGGELIATRLLSPPEVEALLQCRPVPGLQPEQPPDAPRADPISAAAPRAPASTASIPVSTT
jgi:hypothetical protein